MTYQAWVSSVKKALRERQRQSRKTERKEKEGREDSPKEIFSRTGSIFSAMLHRETTLHLSVTCGALRSEVMREE